MPRAFVCGCRATVLDENERAFLKDADPIGVILFRRNIASPEQVAALTAEIRSVLARDDAFVMVDQEGGRVQRLGPPHWRRYPAAAWFGRIDDLEERVATIRSTARLMAHDLISVGINVDCLPVLDVPAAGSHEIVGDRAYAADPMLVATCGRAAADAMLSGGVLPIMKHAPGHGRATADSHFSLPVVDASLEELRASDFAPFRINRDLPAAMTAHVVYSAIDGDWPGTISSKVICDIVRREIGFDGLLFSDDLSMKALPGSFREKALGAFAASVDIALHCNGDLVEASAIAEASPDVSGATLRRVEAALQAMRGTMSAFDLVDAADRLDRMLAETA